MYLYTSGWQQATREHVELTKASDDWHQNRESHPNANKPKHPAELNAPRTTNIVVTQSIIDRIDSSSDDLSIANVHPERHSRRCAPKNDGQ